MEQAGRGQDGVSPRTDPLIDPLINSYDGNGNVTALVNASSGAIAAEYEYGPFGELIRATGSMAFENPFRFSTKYTDDETDFVYYGYRFYNPSAGRWLSRDPIAERGGLNLNALVRNDGINNVDYLGLAPALMADADKCILSVNLKWKLNFISQVNDPRVAWTEEAKARWKENVRNLVESYYSNLPFKCRPAKEDCGVCKDGFKVKLTLSFDDSGDAVDIYKPKGNIREGAGSSNLTLSDQTAEVDVNQHEGLNYTQIPVIHEVGHHLGLRHPGVKDGEPSTGAWKEYTADPLSLMGLGMDMRLKDFQKAFCDKIITADLRGMPWKALEL